MKNTKIFIFNYPFVGSLAHQTYFIIIFIQLYLLRIYYVPGKVKITGKRPCLLYYAICSYKALLIFNCVLSFSLFSSQSHCPPSMGIHSNFYTIYFFHLSQIVNIVFHLSQIVYIVLKLCIVFMWLCLFLMYQMVFLWDSCSFLLFYFFILHFIFKICTFGCISPG